MEGQQIEEPIEEPINKRAKVIKRITEVIIHAYLYKSNSVRAIPD